MNERSKNFVVAVSFLIVIIGVFCANLLTPDAEMSVSERRILAQKPELEAADIWDKQTYQEIEPYLLDQFVLRDSFRALKAFGAYNLLCLSDNNGVYTVGDGIYKLEYPLDEKSVIRAAERFNAVADMWLSDMNVYYSVIPDKNYFIAAKSGHLALDYGRMTDLMAAHTQHMGYIDISDTLAIADYYRTDLHWKQEAILPVAQKLLTGMTGAYAAQPYTPHALQPFYGSYYGQAALPFKPDTLTYLTSETLFAAQAYAVSYDADADMGVRTKIPVYDEYVFVGIDPYSIFLGGPQMIVELVNTQNPNGRELYLFRDSFGSSLAPLMLDGYSKITLIDLRYIDYRLLDERFVHFSKNADALFIVGTQILNHSGMIK